MHKALERQLGVANVEMDTLAGWLTFVYPEPRQIDTAEIADVLDSAGYSLRAISFEVPGEVTRENGLNLLIVDETGQKIPIAGDAQASPSRLVKATVEMDDPVRSVRIEGADSKPL